MYLDESAVADSEMGGELCSISTTVMIASRIEAMDHAVAPATQGDKIFFSVRAAVASQLQVMNLKVFH